MNTKPNLHDFTSSQKRREFLEKELDISLTGTGQIDIEANVENLIGTTQIPLGVAGPLKLRTTNYELPTRNASHSDAGGRTHYIPLATTEGALVASVSRGCKAVTQSDGVIVYVENAGITRGPVFKAKNLGEAMQTKIWIEKNFQILAKTAESTSSHLKLLKADYQVIGRNLFIRFYFDTTDAMGMNMATIATADMVKLIEEKTNIKCVALSGNYCVDKKPSWLNFIKGRGKKVWAEVVLPKKIVKDILKTTPGEIAEVVERKCHLGSIISGSLGFNAHYANITAAVFAATGQDLAHVVEGSLGITTAEVLKNGDLYFSVYMPSVLCGTVGGGTHLPTQQEALKIMKVGSVLEYAQVLGAAVLAGELSLIASLAEGTLAKTHQKLGRAKKI